MKTRSRGPARSTQTSDARIGNRLRAARTSRGLTLDQAAEAAGLTKSFISRLERDEASPSVASLVALCEVLGIRVGALFDPPSTSIVRAGEGRPIQFGGHGVREYLVSPGTQQHLEVIHATIDPAGGGGDELYTLDCDMEFVHVIDGMLTVVIGEEGHDLATGDSMTFPGRTAHTWRNGSRSRRCEVLWVLAPAP